MESTVTQDLEGHSVWLPEIKMEPEDNDESGLDPLLINEEPPHVKQESMTEAPVNVERYPEIPQESNVIKQETILPPETPTHSTTPDNITSQLDQVTHESSKTQPHFDFQREIYVKKESTVYICPVCNKVFPVKYHLKRHLLLHSNKTDSNAHHCTVCNKSFSLKYNLQQHLLSHSDKRQLTANQCNICNKVFTLKCHLKRHLLIHSAKSESNAHQCSVCHKVFYHQELLQRHLVIHADKRDHKCAECGKLFSTLSTLRTHQEKHRPGGYTCGHCDRAFGFKGSLVRHVKRQHMSETGGERFTCPFCSKSYLVNNSLNKHLKTHDSQRCEICNEECADLPSLRTHMTVAHEGEKLHRCETCGKGFVTPEILAKHKEVHNNPFKCCYCHQRFLTNDRLELHQNKKHSNTQHDCDVCSKSFTCQRFLDKHKSVHNKPELCVVCNQAFSTKRRLQCHLSKHHAADETVAYTCGMCSKSFHSVSNLREHEFVHFRPYKCDLCDSSFDRKKRLEHHQEIHARAKNLASDKLESPVTQDLEGHSVWLPEIKMEPEDNDEPVS